MTVFPTIETDSDSENESPLRDRKVMFGVGIPSAEQRTVLMLLAIANSLVLFNIISGSAKIKQL